VSRQKRPGGTVRISPLVLVVMTTVLTAALSLGAWLRPKWLGQTPLWASVGLAPAILAILLTIALTGSERTTDEADKTRSWTKNFLWVVATVLFSLAGITIIGINVVAIAGSLTFWHSVVFQDLASVGTFFAAGAAWLSALVARRSSRDSTSQKTPGTSDDPRSGMTETEYQFLA